MNTLRFLLLLILISWGYSAIGDDAKLGAPLNSIVAIVNNGVITSLDLATATDQAVAQAKASGITVLPERIVIERQVLQNLITQAVILQLAELNHITISDQTVQATIAQIAARNQLTVPALLQKLAASGLNQAAYEASVKKQLMINQLEQASIVGGIVITPSEVSNYLKQTQRLGNLNTEYNVAHILIALPNDPTAADIAAARAKAALVVAKIKAGMPFSEAAMTYSASSDASTGGVLGFETLNQLPTLFAAPVATMSVGQVVGPIESDNGFHILTLLAVKGGQTNASHYVTEYHVEAILIKTSPIKNDAQAQAQLARLRLALLNGASFATLAQSNSEDPVTNKTGGDMGYVTLTTLNPALAAMIQSLSVGALSQPFKTTDGWYLVKVLDTKQVNDTENYLRGQATNALFNQKAQEALQTWQAQIRAASYIYILDPALQPQANAT